ncbi:MAG: hypothetical protein EZS28_037716 [Streblomastix strix]|uniref:Uncharacterized protein n=1 Tax=Streblomastix strix TaxID=222440 RepID=A0A5J4U8M4_9EUKA|nr:MAG: hypothetical protein EZS28_037716 [Streblomastix strix]
MHKYPSSFEDKTREVKKLEIFNSQTSLTRGGSAKNATIEKKKVICEQYHQTSQLRSEKNPLVLLERKMAIEREETKEYKSGGKQQDGLLKTIQKQLRAAENINLTLQYMRDIEIEENAENGL